MEPINRRRGSLIAVLVTLCFGITLLCSTIPAAKSKAPPAGPSSSSRALFVRRILPLLQAKDPSSCSECHLSGVDLKQYIRPSEAQTFAALRDRGMIDISQPDKSRILKFIRMSTPQSPLVMQTVRVKEYTAFRDWIVAAAHDRALAKVPLSRLAIGPKEPLAVIRHTRMDAVEASFTRNIWSQQGRCMNCHEAGTPDNDKNVQKYGPRVAWFKPGSASETMQTLIRQGDIDPNQPDQSLLLLKPLGKVQHGGGVKMMVGDTGYKMFRAWIEDYSKSLHGTYRTAADLPAPAATDMVDLKCILELTGAPAAWGGKSLRVDVFAWDTAGNRWFPEPAASGERGAFLSQDKQSSGTNLIMFLVAPATSSRDQIAALTDRLGQGRFLLKYYVDLDGRLAKDYKLPTNDQSLYQGSQEMTGVWNSRASWVNPVKVTYINP